MGAAAPFSFENFDRLAARNHCAKLKSSCALLHSRKASQTMSLPVTFDCAKNQPCPATLSIHFGTGPESDTADPRAALRMNPLTAGSGRDTGLAKTPIELSWR
jgi:hypothetical protein